VGDRVHGGSRFGVVEFVTVLNNGLLSFHATIIKSPRATPPITDLTS